VQGNGGGERRLEGGWQSNVVERDGVVYRKAGPQTPATLALLRHLESVGFDAAPRVVGSGMSEDGRQTLTFIPGAMQHPNAWSDDGLVRLGELLRRLHTATASFLAPTNAEWRPFFARSLPGAQPVIGHCDLGPWNIIARDGLPIAFIDWDYAGPIDAIWELAQVAWVNGQLHDDDVAEGHQLLDAAGRAEQLRLFVDAYGLEREGRERFVEQMAEFAIHEARQEAIEANVTESTPAIADNGYPILWAVTWRARSASWILRHRAVLHAALVR
jgi:hypothetical protein